jgi:uncharacterized protein (DUF58 family)
VAGESTGRSPTIFTSGFLLLAAGALLYLGLLFRQPGLYLLAALLLLVAGGARLWGALSHLRVAATFKVEGSRVFPGQAIRLDTTVEHGKRLPVGICLDWAPGGAFRPLAPGAPLRQSGLLWRRGLRFRSELVALRRGVHEVAPPRIQTSDPAGIFSRELGSGRSVPVIVYPRLAALKPAALPQRELFGAASLKNPVMDPAYILGTRDYQPSGPSRHIHWKASARRLRLQEKVFEPSGQGSALLALEVSGFEEEQGEEDFERTLEVIASLGVQLARRGFAVGLAANGGVPVVPLGRGARHLPALLEALARLQRRRSASLEQMLVSASCLRRGSVCLAFFRETGAGAQGLDRLCRRHGVPVVGFACRASSGLPGPEPANRMTFRLLSELAEPERDA